MSSAIIIITITLCACVYYHHYNNSVCMCVHMHVTTKLLCGGHRRKQGSETGNKVVYDVQYLNAGPLHLGQGVCVCVRAAARLMSHSG